MAEREAEIRVLEDEILLAFERLRTRLTDQYGPALCGRSRAVFIDLADDVVYKVPRNPDGVIDNSYEARHTDPGIPLAECEIVQIDDLPVLKMEHVNPYHGPMDELPEWTNWVDGGQVGYTKDGRLVAYDL